MLKMEDIRPMGMLKMGIEVLASVTELKSEDDQL